MADVVGKPIDFDQLDQNIMHLKGSGRFSTSAINSSSAMASRAFW